MKNKIIIFLCLFFFGQKANTQDCIGNFGDNIFLTGDFGSGTDNILQTNPNIAPNYTYDTNMPPEDGSYVITANLGLWSDIFEWLEITDNSDDPDGYMMVVNGSIEPGLFFEKEFNNLCENTVYEFSVDIFNLKPITSNSVQPNLSFLLNNTEIYVSGDVPENEAWNNYGFTFMTGFGQTSIVLSLRNNAPGGSGNDFAMDNIRMRPCTPNPLMVRRVYFPNAFSPNADGINDFFTIYGELPDVVVVENLMIFDRWGNQIHNQSNFLPNEENVGWDGTFKGKLMPVGTYVYVAEVRFLDGETAIYRGDILLVK